MPTYEYQCQKCKKTFDIFQSMKEPALKTCPENLCRQKKWGKGSVRRLLGTGAGLIFKGSGFYITDYRSHGYKEAAKKETAPAAGSGTEKKAPKKEASSNKPKKD
jgi:putative FmdB family regulatory protein